MQTKLTRSACIMSLLLAGAAAAQSNSKLLDSTWEARLCLDNTTGNACSSSRHIQPGDLFGIELDKSSEIFVFLEKTDWGSVHSFPAKTVALCQTACKNPTFFASFMDFGTEKTLQITVVKNERLSEQECQDWLADEAPVNEMSSRIIEEQCQTPDLAYWHIATVDQANGDEAGMTIPPDDGHGTGTPPD